jgi:hypothetical protein
MNYTPSLNARDAIKIAKTSKLFLIAKKNYKNKVKKKMMEIV